MKKLAKNLIIGASATTAVAGAGAGAAVAFTHKDKDAKETNQAAQTTVQAKPAVDLPGQEELKAAQSAQEHNMLDPNHVPEDKTTHISATDVKTEVPHAMEFFVPATFGDKVVDDSINTESLAARKDKEEKALAAAFKHAIETEDKSEHIITIDNSIDVPTPTLIVEMPEAVEVPSTFEFEVKAPSAQFIQVDDRHIAEGAEAQSVEFDVKAPEAKFIPISEFHDIQEARQDLVQQAIDFENEKAEREIAVKEQIHQTTLAQQAAEAAAQEVQEKLEDFVNELNHYIHSMQMNAEEGAELASYEVSHLTKGNNGGQIAEDQAKLMEAGARAYAQDVQEQVNIRKDQISDARHTQAQAEEKLNEQLSNQRALVADALDQFAHRLHELKNEEANEADANAEFAKTLVSQLVKGHNQGQIEQDQRDQTRLMELGARSLSADMQGEILARAEALTAARHAANEAEAEQLAKAQESQEKLEDFVNELNHYIHEKQLEEANQMDENAELARTVVAQLTKGNNQGQIEQDQKDQARLMELGAKQFAADTEDIVQERLGSINQARHEEAKAQEAYQAKLNELREAAINFAEHLQHTLHELQNEADNNADVAAGEVSHLTKGNNGGQVLADLQNAERARGEEGARAFAAQQAALQKHELSRDEVATLEAGLISNEDRGRELVASYEKQAAETAKNYALAESEIEARLLQRQHEEDSHKLHSNLDHKKASSIAQEMYETQRHGAEVEALRVAQEVFNRQRAEYEAEYKGEQRQAQLERDGDYAQSHFVASIKDDQETLIGDKRSGQEDYESSQRAHAARLAGEAAAKEFAAEMEAAQQHAKEVEQAGSASEKLVEEQIRTEVATQAVQYEQHRTEVAQVLETRELASIQKELDAAQVKLVADAHNMHSTELTQNQMNELSTWRLVDRQEASKILPSSIVDKLFASKIVDQVNISLSGNDDSSTLFAIAFSHGENADGSLGYAEFAITKHHEQPAFQRNTQFGAPHFGNHQPQQQVQQQAPAAQFVDYKANQVIYNINNAGAITMTGGVNVGDSIDLFHPPHGVKVSSTLVNQLKANGVTSARAVILVKGSVVAQGTYGSTVRFFLNGQETIHETYFAIRTF